MVLVKRFQKIVSMLMVLVLFLPVFALAEDLSGCAVASGTVTAPGYVDIIAPCSGTLNTFDLEAGDAVSEGDALFSLLTTGIYATEDGTVGAVFAHEGSDAAAVTSRYGCVIAIEPEQLLVISATTSGAYSDVKNRTIHTGETVYYEATNNTRRVGIGRVTYVDGSTYLIEVTDNDVDIGSAVTIYRNDDHTTKSCIGKGTLTRRADVQVQASGRVAALHVQEGDEVKEGDLLLEVLGNDAAPGVSPTLTAPADGIIATVAVSAGQQVWKGALLCRIYLTGTLEVTASVDEMDLGELKVGDTLNVTLDVDAGKVIKGTVTEISGLGVTKTNAAYYTVKVEIPAGSARLGASASVYLPR